MTEFKKGDLVMLGERSVTNRPTLFPYTGDLAIILDADEDNGCRQPFVYWQRLARKGPWAGPELFTIISASSRQIKEKGNGQ